MKIDSNLSLPITRLTPPELETKKFANQKPLNSDAKGRYDVLALSKDLANLPIQVQSEIVITPIDKYAKRSPEAIINIKALGFTEEESKKVEDFILDIQKGLRANASDSYSNFALLGISRAKVKFFAEQNFSSEKADKLISSFDQKVDDHKNASNGFYNIIDNSRYFSKGRGYPCNRQLKDNIYDVFANLDTSTKSNFDASFKEAQNKYIALKKPYYVSMGYDSYPGSLQETFQYNLKETSDIFSGNYREIKSKTIEELEAEIAKVQANFKNRSRQ